LNVSAQARVRSGYFLVPVPVVPGFFLPVVPEPVVVPVVPVEPLPDALVPAVEELDEPPAPPAPEPPVAPVLPPAPMPEPLPALPVPPVLEPVPVVVVVPPVPEPVASVLAPEPMPEPVVLPEPMPPVLGVVPVPAESVIVPEVVSGDFAGSLLPPQATTLPIASAVRNAYEIFMRAPEFVGEHSMVFEMRAPAVFRCVAPHDAQFASPGRFEVRAAVHRSCPGEIRARRT
jgi:hypothetical protein